MKKKYQNIAFQLKQIETEQFAIVEEAFNESERIQFNYTFSFGADQEQKVIAAFGIFRFLSNEKPFIILKVSCYFAISPESWKLLKIEDTRKLRLDKDFLCNLMTITVGTSRGILHTKTENTFYNKFLVPTINVESAIAEDLIIE